MIKNLVSIIGLGYVGLPLALEFSKKNSVIGFDINLDRINDLKRGFDKYHLFKNTVIKKSKIFFTNKIENIFDSNFLIITLPTPVNSKYTRFKKYKKFMQNNWKKYKKKYDYYF